MPKYFWIAILIGLALGLASTQNAQAQAQAPNPAGPTDDEVNAVAKQLYCPVCENIPLDVCPTQACAQWRDLIRQKLSDGWSEQQIKDFFVEQYGERVLGAPPAHGINWMVYLVPPLALVAGAFIVYRTIRSMRLKPTTQTAISAAPADEYVRRLEEELRKKN